MVMDQLRDIKHQFQNEIEGSEDLSLEAEKRIARSFMGRIEWEMIAIGLTQCFLWFGVWAMVLAGLMPLWLGFSILVVTVTFAYLPSHAGQHGHLS